jgi:hypothetical protein
MVGGQETLLFHQYILEDAQNTCLFHTFLLDENMHVHTHKHNTHTTYMSTNVHMVNMCTHAYGHPCTHAHTQLIMIAYVQHTHHTHGHMPAQTTYNICVHMHMSTHTHTQHHTHGHMPPQTTYNITHTCTCRHIQHTPQAHKSTHTYDTQIAKVN